jgi:hypothetical protein
LTKQTRKQAADKPAGPDWALIKQHWDAGILSIREIARQAGITHRAVSKHAELHEWGERGRLTDAIRDSAQERNARNIAAEAKAQRAQKPKAQTHAEPVSTERKDEAEPPRSPERVANSDALAIADTDADVVEANAEAQAAVMGLHRRDARAHRLMIGRLLAELDHTTSHLEDIEAEIWKETAGDRSGQRRAMMLRAVSLPSRAGVMRDLATAATKVVNIERQAFGIVEPDPNRLPGGEARGLAARIQAFEQQREVTTTTTTTDGEGRVVQQQTKTTLQQRLARLD